MSRIRKVFDVVVHNIEDNPAGPLQKSLHPDMPEEQVATSVLCISLPQLSEDPGATPDSLIKEIPHFPPTAFMELPDFSSGARDCLAQCQNLAKAPREDVLDENFSISIRIFPFRVKDKTLNFGGRDISIEGPGGKKRVFRFAKVFPPTTSNTEIYNSTVCHMEDHFAAGESGTCFTFGQTCSGKTHTLFNTERPPGICLQFGTHVLGRLGELSVSIYEIYNERIKDLLGGTPRRTEMCATADGGVEILNLSRRRVGSVGGLVETIHGCLGRRAVHRGRFDHPSSRSHLVVKLENTPRNSQFYFIDLAGSERARGTTGPASWSETASINSTLLAVKECIRGYAHNSAHVPFRRSKISRLLNHVFKSYKIFAICTVREDEAAHSINTLEYAQQLDLLSNGRIPTSTVPRGREDRPWSRKVVRRMSSPPLVTPAFQREYVHKLIKTARGIND